MQPLTPEHRVAKLGEQTHWVNSETGTGLILTPEIEMNLDVAGKTSHTESGGVLVGERRGPHFLITHLTMPMPTDTRRPLSIRRSPKGHVDFIERLVKESKGRLSYCGEWHTHPQRHPSPSGTDIDTWIRLNRELNIPLIHIIAGTASISAFQALRGRVDRMSAVL